MWQERVLGRFSQLSSLSMLNCTTFFLTIWDFVHEFFEIINKRNIVSDYENEMYSFFFVKKILIRQARLTLKLKTTL